MPASMTEQDKALLAKWRDLAGSGAAREVRLLSGLTGREVARRVGVSWSAVHYWEHRQGRRPSGEAGLKYARLMEGLAKGLLRPSWADPAVTPVTGR